jgi:hypothetical protein
MSENLIKGYDEMTLLVSNKPHKKMMWYAWMLREFNHNYN